MDISFINKLLALGTIGAGIFLVFMMVLWVFSMKKSPLFVLVKTHALRLAFATALFSMVASLFYSEIAKYPPCELCWLQRFFMYPLVVLLGINLWKKELNLIPYSLGLSILGFLTAVYHNLMYYSTGGLSSLCQTLGSSVSCTKRYVFEFGFVTIPIMSLVAFALLILFLSIARAKTSAENSPTYHDLV